MVSRGQQRGNPFSLMNHETRQRHRNTLKEECGGARSFVALPLPSIFPSFAPPLRSIFIFLSFFSTPDSFQLRILHFSPQLSFQFLRCSKKTTYLEISSPPPPDYRKRNFHPRCDRAPISRAEERSTPPLGEIYREKGKREPPTAERFQPDSRMKVDEPFHALRAPISRSRVNTNY